MLDFEKLNQIRKVCNGLLDLIQGRKSLIFPLKEIVNNVDKIEILRMKLKGKLFFRERK